MSVNVKPNTTRAFRPAAAIVTNLGEPVRVRPMWRQLSGDIMRAVRACNLRPIEYVDFYWQKPRNRKSP